MTTLNHYQLLEVAPTADRRAIRAAYRSALRRHHPDANAGSREGEILLRQVIAAGRILSDPHRRERYDRTLAAYPGAQPPQEEKTRQQALFGTVRLALLWTRILHQGMRLRARFFSAELAAETETRARPRRQRNPQEFSHFLYRALHRRSAVQYQRGEDGIYRKKAGKTCHRRRTQRHREHR